MPGLEVQAGAPLVSDAPSQAVDVGFESFFRAQLPRARRVAYRILGDVTEAEDAAAEAFARAHASWRRVGGLPHRDAWVLRVASNVAIDTLRRRRTPLFEREVTTGTHEDGAILQLSLVHALGSLPRRQREVITLRFIVGYSEAEVAASLGVSAGTVKKAVHRGIATLRERLGPEWSRGLEITEADP